MSRKPENTFILSVHRYLPPKEELHREKMNNPYSSGTADWWYSGSKADQWVEYKFLPKLPVRALIVPDLSELQKDWLGGRYREGRRVAVIVGCPEGGVIYENRSWLEAMNVEEFRDRLCTRQQLAEWLMHRTMKGRK